MKKIIKKIIRVIENPWRLYHFFSYKLLRIRTDHILNDGERFDPRLFKQFGLNDKNSVNRYRFAQQLVDPNDTVLDIACGTGYGTLMLGEKCLKATGVDNHERAIEYAQKRYQKNEKINFIKADLFANTVQAETVVSFETIEHLKNDITTSLEKLLSFTQRQLIISVPYREKENNNKHHCHFQLDESHFAVLKNHGKINFFYQTLGGNIQSEKPANIETLLCVLEINRYE